MKKTVLLLTCAILVLSFAGCATDKASDNKAPQPKQEPKKAQNQKDPEIGMTKDQILAMYGKTNNIRVSNQGETWTYDNFGEAHIPFNFGFRAKMRIIIFDKDGKVTNWSYNK